MSEMRAFSRDDFKDDFVDESDAQAAVDYFGRFAYAVEITDEEKGHAIVRCPGCGSRIYGHMGAMGHAFGLYTFEYGIAHGEGFCSHVNGEGDRCGWPVCAHPHVELPSGKVASFPLPLPYAQALVLSEHPGGNHD